MTSSPRESLAPVALLLWSGILLGCGAPDDGARPPRAPADGAAKRSAAPAAPQTSPGARAAAEASGAPDRPADDLRAHLPRAPSGWTADPAESVRQTVGEWTLVAASGNYERDGRLVHAEIMDGGSYPGVIAPFQAMPQFSQESSDGFMRSTTIAGHAAIETWEREGSHGELQVLVGERFLVRLEGTGLSAEELRDWLGRCDLEGLARMAD